jgi:hypothetical protein
VSGRPRPSLRDCLLAQPPSVFEALTARVLRGIVLDEPERASLVLIRAQRVARMAGFHRGALIGLACGALLGALVALAVTR